MAALGMFTDMWTPTGRPAHVSSLHHLGARSSDTSQQRAHLVPSPWSLPPSPIQGTGLLGETAASGTRAGNTQDEPGESFHARNWGSICTKNDGGASKGHGSQLTESQWPKWNNLRKNKTNKQQNKVVLGYSPTCKTNIYKSMLI